MTMFLLMVAGLLSPQAAPPAGWKPVDDPLVPARQGAMLCADPDHGGKTCHDIIKFEFGEAGFIVGESWTVVESNLPVSIQIKSKVEVRNSKICFRITAKDIDDAAFLVGDKPVVPEEIDLLQKDVRSMLADDIAGKQLCHRHFINGDNLMVRVFVDGVEDIDAASPVAWIDKAAGYRLLLADQIYND